MQLFIAVFFILGADKTNRSLYILYQSYFADIFIPFGFYFLLSLGAAESKYSNTWWKKALAIFALCTISEILQYFGIFALAMIFDPVDIVMYGIGVLLASIVDRKVFTRMFSFWD